MICSRCSQWNSEDDHRCRRCATRLTDRRVESAFYSHGSAALRPQIVTQSSAVALEEAPAPPVTAPEEPAAPRGLPRYVSSLQQTLFSTRDREKIVSIDGGETAQRPARRRQQQNRRSVTASYLPAQGVLEFVPIATPQARKLGTSVDARIFCEQEVASVAHRSVAALYDFGHIVGLVLVFLGMLYWGCEGLGTAFLNAKGAAMLFVAIGTIGLVYHGAFLAFRGRTPGMEYAGLRLVDFDGRPVRREHVEMRIFGTILSVLPLGLGLLWALVDEESLSWQDHISQTFPTPDTRN